MDILIICGHGAGDPGACRGSLREAELTRELGAKLHALLPHSTTLYDTARNAFRDVTTGKLTVGDLTAYDMVLELHFNAAKSDSGDGRVKGTECWLPTAATDTALGLALCGAMERLGMTNRGVKRKNFSVIHTAHKAGLPALLLEVCFLDDADDMKRYDPDKTAAAIAETLTEELALDTEESWAWFRQRGLLTEADRNRPITGSELAEVLYKLYGGE